MDEPVNEQMHARIEIVTGDITGLDVDAIVNAANSSLLGGGGVDGAIHRAAGPQLLAFCRGLGGCQTGDAKITPGFGLRARHVIHTVGPIWHGGRQGEPEQLASCYRRCLELAEAHDLKSLAFPAISTGAYGYPLAEATQMAVKTVQDWLASHPLPQRVLFVCFGKETERAYQEELSSDG